MISVDKPMGSSERVEDHDFFDPENGYKSRPICTPVGFRQ